jgi:hypothetical protein
VKKLSIQSSHVVEHTHDEIAEALANMDSAAYAALMKTYTEYLESACGRNGARAEQQECHIAASLGEEAKKFFRSVVTFIDIAESENK